MAVVSKMNDAERQSISELAEKEKAYLTRKRTQNTTDERMTKGAQRIEKATHIQSQDRLGYARLRMNEGVCIEIDPKDIWPFSVGSYLTRLKPPVPLQFSSIQRENPSGGAYLRMVDKHSTLPPAPTGWKLQYPQMMLDNLDRHPHVHSTVTGYLDAGNEVYMVVKCNKLPEYFELDCRRISYDSQPDPLASPKEPNSMLEREGLDAIQDQAKESAEYVDNKLHQDYHVPNNITDAGPSGATMPAIKKRSGPHELTSLDTALTVHNNEAHVKEEDKAEILEPLPSNTESFQDEFSVIRTVESTFDGINPPLEQNDRDVAHSRLIPGLAPGEDPAQDKITIESSDEDLIKLEENSQQQYLPTEYSTVVQPVDVLSQLFHWCLAKIRIFYGCLVHDILEYLGPGIVPLLPNNIRVLWQCNCGNLLFEDFPSTERASAELIKQALLDTGHAACAISNDGESGDPSHTHSGTAGVQLNKSSGNEDSAQNVRVGSQTDTSGDPPYQSRTSMSVIENNSDDTGEAKRCWLLSCLPFFEDVPEAALVAVHVPLPSLQTNDRILLDLVHDEYSKKRFWYHRAILCLDVVQVSLAKFAVQDDPFEKEEITTNSEDTSSTKTCRQLAYIDKDAWAPPWEYDLSGWRPTPGRTRPKVDMHLWTLWRWRCSAHRRHGDWLHSLARLSFSHLQPFRLALRCCIKRSVPTSLHNDSTSDVESRTIALPSRHSEQVAVTLEEPSVRDAGAVSRILPKKIGDKLVVLNPSEPPLGWGIVLEEGFCTPRFARRLYTLLLIASLWAVPIVGVMCVVLLFRHGVSVFGAWSPVIECAALLLASGKYFGMMER